MITGCHGVPPSSLATTSMVGTPATRRDSGGSSDTRVSPPLRPRKGPGGAGCRLYNNTDCSGGYDLSNEPMGKVTATAEACVAECAKNCACAVGVWGRTAQGTHRCYLKSKGPQLGRQGAFKGNLAFECTPTCAPPKPPRPPSPSPSHHHYGGGIKFAEWAKLGIDPGSSISELPSTAEIIRMGMAVLLHDGDE